MNDTDYAELRSLVEHTKDELHRAGLFDKESDYDGMIGRAVLAIMKVFAKQGHSGFSAQWCRELFHTLSNFETLTPITSDPHEWEDVSKMCNGKPMWQNKRNPAMFSEDGGKTWYDVNEKETLSQLEKRNAELIKVSVKDYDPSKLSNAVLGDDFRIIMTHFATLKAGGKPGYSEKDIRAYMKKIVAELVKRDRVTFNQKTMKDTSKELLADTLRQLYRDGIPVVPDHGALIYEGKKTAVVKPRKLDLKDFYALISGKLAYGMIRFEQPQEIDLKEFEKRKDEHRITEEERSAWWGDKKKPLFLYRIRDFVPFKEPIKASLPEDAQGVVMDAKLSPFDLCKLQLFPTEVKKHGIESIADIVPENLERLTKTELVLLNAYLEAEFESAYRKTGIQQESIVNAGAFVRQEMEKRSMEIRQR